MTESRASYRIAYNQKVDANHKVIFDGLIAAGYRAFNVHRAGEGYGDIVCLSKTHIPVLFEVKMPGGSLTPKEKEFGERYHGPYHVIHSLVEALGWMAWYDLQEMAVT